MTLHEQKEYNFKYMYLIYLEENFRENVKTCMSLFDKFSTNELKKNSLKMFCSSSLYFSHFI